MEPQIVLDTVVSMLTTYTALVTCDLFVSLQTMRTYSLQPKGKGGLDPKLQTLIQYTSLLISLLTL